MDRDLATLLDIEYAARRVLEFVQNIEQAEALESDSKTLDAVLYRMAVIGEAARRLSDDFKNEHSHIPWRRIIAMRNILIHVYDQIDIERVWDVIQVNIPELLEYIQPLLPRR